MSNLNEPCVKGGVKVNRFMFFLVYDSILYLSEKAAEIAHEENAEKRKFLYEEYQDMEDIHKLYMRQMEDGKDCFSWRYCFDSGFLSLHNLGHFKPDLLKDGITEEEWQKEVEKTYESIGEEKVKEYLKEYGEYVERHYRS